MFGFPMSYIYRYALIFSADVIVLYPAHSLIFKEGWKGEEMFILIHGQ